MIIGHISIYKKDFFWNKDKNISPNHENDHKNYIDFLFLIYNSLAKNSVSKNNSRKHIDNLCEQNDTRI